MDQRSSAREIALGLRSQAEELGFDLVGIAPAGPTAGAEHLEAWLAAGMHADMDWMRRSVTPRADPRHHLAGCRSVVAVAMSYHQSGVTSSASSLGGDQVWVSRYAWGRDYHTVLKKRLIRLGRWLASVRPRCSWRACTDTAPVMERAWAAAAGLGWIGKNTQLMHRSLGSELFLGVLLTDVELACDQPTSSHCGHCTACLDACPTGALVRPYVLDSRRCIAYLTVEHRSTIPSGLVPYLGRMVAGCDLCQEACPWNRRAASSTHPEFAPAPGRLHPRLSELEALDDEGFRRWRSGSPLTRIPFASFRRTLDAVRRNVAGGPVPEISTPPRR